MAAEHETPAADVLTAAVLMPVDGASAGGDFCLAEDVGSLTVALVGDVMGNGEDAAPYADRLSAELKHQVRGAHDPAELLEQLNASIYGDPDFDRYTTACAVIIERPSWAAQWAFAGHLPPHWLDTGMPIDGATPGLPLGLRARMRRHQRPATAATPRRGDASVQRRLGGRPRSRRRPVRISPGHPRPCASAPWRHARSCRSGSQEGGVRIRRPAAGRRPVRARVEAPLTAAVNTGN